MGEGWLAKRRYADPPQGWSPEGLIVTHFPGPELEEARANALNDWMNVVWQRQRGGEPLSEAELAHCTNESNLRRWFSTGSPFEE